MKKCKRKIALTAIAAALGIVIIVQTTASATPPSSHHHHHHHHTTKRTTSTVNSQPASSSTTSTNKPDSIFKNVTLKSVPHVLDVLLPNNWRLGKKLPRSEESRYEQIEENLLKLVARAIKDFRNSCNNINQKIPNSNNSNTETWRMDGNARWQVEFSTKEANVSDILINAQESLKKVIGNEDLCNKVLNNSDVKSLCETIRKIIKIHDKKIVVDGKRQSISDKSYLKKLVEVLEEETEELKEALGKLNENFPKSVESAIENQASTSSSSSSSPLSSPKPDSSSSSSRKH